MLSPKHRSVVVLCSLLGLLPPAYADQSPALSILGGVEQFRWREIDTDKRELLEESGQRYSVAVNYDNLRRLNSGSVYSVGGKLYLGAVDYDGETQLTSIPVQSTTTYFGMQVDALGGYRFASHLHGLDILAGGGLDFWWRSIDDTYVPGLGQVYGGDEVYRALYAKVGLGYFHEMGKARHYVQAGLKYPFYVYEYGYQDYADDLTLNPKGRVSFFAKYQWEFGGTTLSRWGATLYYDSYRFSQSDAEIMTANGVPIAIAWQPESHQDVYGLQIGLYFR
jgi:hypothetical protein